jgi:hypothetical protein
MHKYFPTLHFLLKKLFLERMLSFSINIAVDIISIFFTDGLIMSSLVILVYHYETASLAAS